MGSLLLNTLTVHHPRAFRDLQKEHPRQADLLVGKNNVDEFVTAHSNQPASPK